MEDERLVVVDPEQLGQVRLGGPDVDVGVAVVAEDPEAAVEVEVHRRRLEVVRVVRVDAHVPRLDGGPDVAVREDAHQVLAAGLVEVSTSRLRSSRSSKLWYTLANRM